MKTFATYRPNLMPQSRSAAEQIQPETIRVLIVEDDPTLLTTLQYSLTRAGYLVQTAIDGESALARAREDAEQLDVVILDVMLPGMNGYQVLREIRSSSDVPVMMLSARGEEQDKVDGLELGADDYIVKPFAMRELVARIRSISRRRAVKAAQPPAVLFRGALRIEPDRRVASVSGRELRLRPKEFGLLLTLAMDPGRVFDRQSLLDEVWGRDVVVDERTVDVHISWLRGKLHRAGMPADTIRTIYGAGYRLDLPALEEASNRHDELAT
jgi:DNA-binding response OmpR family regulator